MSDSKKYYYMRLKENFFSDEKILILEGLPDGIKYSNILLKLYLRSLKYDGRLMVDNIIPYDINMLSSVTGHDESTVRCALEVFQNLGLIEKLDNGAIYMLNIQNFIGKSSTEADRIRKYERKIAEEKLYLEQGVEIYKKSTPEIRDKSIEYRDKNIERENNMLCICSTETLNSIKMEWNSRCTSLAAISSFTDERKRAVENILTSYSQDQLIEAFDMVAKSDWCNGRTDKSDWRATFDWLIEKDNLEKVLSGNYDNYNYAKRDYLAGNI